MRVGIIGSRKRSTSSDSKLVESLLKELRLEFADLVVVSGGCEIGPDFFARQFARELGIQLVEHLPNLPDRGSPRHKFTESYYARNQEIASDVDMLIALVSPDRKGGTEDTITRAARLGVRILIK